MAEPCPVPFCAEAYLAAPLAVSPRGLPFASLDTLLYRALAGRDGAARLWYTEEEMARAEGAPLPLARRVVGGREIWCGSIAFPVGPVAWGHMGWTKRWAGARGAVSAGTGPMRDRMEAYMTLAAVKVRFYGFGDVEAAGRLLRRVSGLGHKRNRGHGRVLSWRVYPIRADHSVWLRLPGMVCPARVLPWGALSEESGAVHLPALGNPGFPRWARNVLERVVLPPPFLWQEGLADGPAERPEPNRSPGTGEGSLDEALRRWRELTFDDEDPLAGL